MKELYIIRGISGSGKSTFARSIVPSLNVIEADMYFTQPDGSYKFNPDKLKEAHQWCFNQVKHMMNDDEEKIAVANTFTRYWEFKKYIKLAYINNYNYHVLTVENYHGGESVHDVPEETIKKQADRFQFNFK